MSDEAMRRPIIFLDIDGVLVIKSYPARPRMLAYAGARRRAGLPALPMILRAANMFVPAAVGHLNDLCAQTVALLVLSSSWRLRDDVHEQLAAAGITAPFHPDWRTDSAGPLRSDEIQRWVDAHGRPPFVVLDDWPHELEALASVTVRTNYRTGLTSADCDAARVILSATAQ